MDTQRTISDADFDAPGASHSAPDGGVEGGGLRQSPVEQAPPTLLVLDDEAAIADLVTSIFQAEGFRVLTFCDPRAALETAKKGGIDLALVDIMMPVMDGFEFCRRLGLDSDISVVFLTAKDEETDVLVGFALGADDYVTKPFKPRELVARVKARLRKRQGASASAASGIPGERESAPQPAVLSAMGIELDQRSHQAHLHDILLSLTPKEFAILACLLQNAGSPVASRTLYEQVWGQEPDRFSANTVMVHIRHLRCKLAEIDSSTEFITTAWGVGYMVPVGRG